jgi:hypothetical protein
MKLFKSLLVAPATLGLLAPMAATANEVTVNDFNPSIENTLLAGGEGLVDSHSHDGGFSETTSASFSADFAIGSVDGVAAEDTLGAVYGFQIDLNTSFTGEDSFDVSLDAGNGGNTLTEIDLNEFNDTDDALGVDGISYTFPLGDKTTIMVGNDVAGSSLYSTACVYGGPTNTLDDCGNANSAMDSDDATAFSASYDIGNGFTAAVGYEGDGDGALGLMTLEGSDVYGAQLSYAADSYAASLTYANYDTSTTDTVYWGLNGYWTPSESGSFPSISAGYEVGNASNTSIDTSHYFVGFQWDEIGPGTLGAAFGTQAHTAENAQEFLMYEAFYSYPINDAMSVTPVVYIKETATGTDDETGIMVKTSFSF